MDAPLLAFAFTAGAVAFFAPCCVGMLPAYVGYAVRPPSRPSVVSKVSHAPSRLALFGFAPVLLGLVPLLARGLGSFGLLANFAYHLLPTLEASLALLLVGAGIILAGVALAGQARAAARGIFLGLVATTGVLVAITGITVAGGANLGARLKQHSRAIERASAWMLLLAGAYMTYYYARILVLVGI